MAKSLRMIDKTLVSFKQTIQETLQSKYDNVFNDKIIKSENCTYLHYTCSLTGEPTDYVLVTIQTEDDSIEYFVKENF